MQCLKCKCKQTLDETKKSPGACVKCGAACRTVLIVAESGIVSSGLMVERRIPVELPSSDLLQVGHVMVVDASCAPKWIAEVAHFEIPSGSFPAAVTIQLSRVANLADSLDKLKELTNDETNFQPGEVVLVDADGLLGLGLIFGRSDELSEGVLTSKEAKKRLAWTYGVPEDQVKIAIEL